MKGSDGRDGVAEGLSRTGPRWWVHQRRSEMVRLALGISLIDTTSVWP